VRVVWRRRWEELPGAVGAALEPPAVMGAQVVVVLAGPEAVLQAGGALVADGPDVMDLEVVIDVAVGDGAHLVAGFEATRSARGM
jgi:hypothetical protein